MARLMIVMGSQVAREDVGIVVVAGSGAGVAALPYF